MAKNTGKGNAKAQPAKAHEVKDQVKEDVKEEAKEEVQETKAEETKVEETKTEETPETKTEEVKEEKKEETSDADKAKQEQEKVHKLYVKAMELIRGIVPKDKFKEKENNSGITFFGSEGTRAFKVIEAKKGLKLELNVPVTETEELTVLTEKEASDKHMGTCRWIYVGDSLDTVKKLVTEAIEKYVPKKRSDSKEEKDKKETAKAEGTQKKEEKKEEKKPDSKTQKTKDYNKDNQSHAKNGKVTTRQMTEEEKAALEKTGKTGSK